MNKKHWIEPLFGLLLLGVVACGGPTARTVRIPPRIDLQPRATIGIVQFDSAAEGQLAPLATRRFVEAMRVDQGMLPVLDLGTEVEALRTVGHERLDAAALRALAQHYDVRSIVLGTLTVSRVRPGLHIDNLRSGSLTAQVDAMLEVEMVEASSGASIWSSSANARSSVGHVSVSGGKDFRFNARDADEAYGDLVNALVQQATRDFQASWQRR